MKITKYLALVAFVAALLCGCATTPKQTTYKSLAAIGAAANNAGDAIAQARLQGKVSDANWERAVQVQAKFLLAYSEACRLASYEYTSYAPAQLLAIQAELINTITTILALKP